MFDKDTHAVTAPDNRLVQYARETQDNCTGNKQNG